MIKNDRQFSIIQARVDRLRQTRDELLERLEEEGADLTRAELELKAVRAEIARMEGDLADYKALKQGDAPVGTATSLEDVPRLLVRARLASGLSHAELAARLGLKEQQIQRYEATDYESASLSRLIQVAHVLGLTLGPQLQAEESSWSRTLLRNLEHAGLTREFVKRRFGGFNGEPSSVTPLVTRVAHAYGCTPEEVLHGDVLTGAGDFAPRAYKKPQRASDRQAAMLSGYARYLTEVIAKAVKTTVRTLPKDPLQLYRMMSEDREDPPSFAEALKAVWNVGIPVLPLNEGGGFHAGYWSPGSRNVIVLNATSQEASRWLFYILHEMGHIVDDHDDPELVEVTPGQDPVIAKERENQANEYATAAIFGSKSEELFNFVQDKSGGDLANMQRAVRYVARHHHVDIGALAFNVAYRLAQQGHDWWGAAMNLQGDEADCWRITRDALLERLDWESLDSLDADLLARALETSPPEGSPSAGRKL